MRTPRILPSELIAAILWPCSREVLYSYIIEPLDKSTPTDLVRNCETICMICIRDDDFENYNDKRPEDWLVGEEVVAQVLKHCLDHLVLLHHLRIILICIIGTIRQYIHHI